MTRDCAKVAAALMRHLCDHDWHGYSQGDRWGDGEGVCEVTCYGETFYLEQGDRDCSSAVISCWREALRGTDYEGCLDDATYTGNMRRVFRDSGLFEVWDTSNSSACIGDIYLNDADHTAMCVDDGTGELGYDALGEFSQSENYSCYGEVGDQTGWESLVHGYYDFPWDCTLHYNGKADGNIEHHDDSTEKPASSFDNARYRLHTLGGDWLGWMKDYTDEAGGTDDYAGEPYGNHDMLMVEGAVYRVHTTAGQWLDWVSGCDESDEVNGMAGNWGEAIDGIQLKGGFTYRVQTTEREGWLDWVVDDSDFAGVLGEPIDRLQIVRS